MREIRALDQLEKRVNALAAGGLQGIEQLIASRIIAWRV
jgi:hypothetical protein